MGYTRSFAIHCYNLWAEQPSLEALGLGLQAWPCQWSGSKRNFWRLCCFGDWNLVVRWMCDPEPDVLMGVSCSFPVAVLVGCTVLFVFSAEFCYACAGTDFLSPSCPSLVSVALGLFSVHSPMGFT